MNLKLDKALLIGSAVGLLALAQVTADAVQERVAAVGKIAPKFELQTENGRTLTRDNFGGKLLVVNFWATWCPPCIQEMPSLNRLASDLRKEGVIVVAVSIDEKEAPYKQFLTSLQPQFLTSRDSAGDIASLFGTAKVPETYVIDHTGRVLQKYIDARDWMEPAMQSEIRAFLQSK